MKKEELLNYKKFLLSLSKENKILRNKYLHDLSSGVIYGPMTGYSSIDKPWLKYYDKENIGLDYNHSTAYNFMKNSNKNNLESKSISYFNKKLTFKELLNKIDNVTKGLINLGIKEGDIVTLVSANTPENVFLFYALNRIGAVSNIIDPRLKSNEVLEAIIDCDSKYLFSLDVNITNEELYKIKNQALLNKIVLFSPFESFNKIEKIIASKNMEKKLFNYSKDVLDWNTFLNNGKDLEIIEAYYKPNMPAVMVRTGGTTGKPKTVVLSNDNLNEMAFQHDIGDYNFKSKDTFLNFLPPFISYGICAATHMPLALGLENILLPIFDPNDFPSLMKKYKPNVVFGGPILYEKMIIDKKTSNMDLSYFKVPVSGGDTMLPETEKKINEYFENHNCENKVGQGYGMTEVASSCCFSKSNAIENGSVGIPLINNTISIFNPDTMEEKLINETGEICIKTNTMMLGYYNNINETNKVIKEHDDKSLWVHTGDLGYINNNGNLFVIGRMKRIIVSNGSKIFPTTIENIISQNNKVLLNAVVGMEHKEYRKVPVAHIVVDCEQDELPDLVNNIIYEIKKELPDFYVPLVFIIRNDLPLTSINKVDFKALESEIYNTDKLIIVKDDCKVLKKAK